MICAWRNAPHGFEVTFAVAEQTAPSAGERYRYSGSYRPGAPLSVRTGNEWHRRRLPLRHVGGLGSATRSRGLLEACVYGVGMGSAPRVCALPRRGLALCFRQNRCTWRGSQRQSRWSACRPRLREEDIKCGRNARVREPSGPRETGCV